MSTTYTVRFSKQIHASHSGFSTADVLLERTEILPISPFVGLEVVRGDWVEEITAVYVDLESGVIHAAVEANKEIYVADLKNLPHRDIDLIAQAYLENGWFLRGDEKGRIAF